MSGPELITLPTKLTPTSDFSLGYWQHHNSAPQANDREVNFSLPFPLTSQAIVCQVLLILPPKYFWNSFLCQDIPETAQIKNIQSLTHYFPFPNLILLLCVLGECYPHPLSC